MKRFLLIVGVLLAIVSVAIPVLSATRRATSETPAMRATQRNGSWTYGCGGDTCVGTVLDPLKVTTPSEATTFDAVVTLTLDYRTSAKDIGLVQLRYRTSGGPHGVMPPKTYPLTARSRTSTTLTWSLNDLPASGVEYVFTPLIEIEDRGRYGYSIEGGHMLMVAELWS
jgi:hypothetical protein